MKPSKEAYSFHLVHYIKDHLIHPQEMPSTKQLKVLQVQLLISYSITNKVWRVLTQVILEVTRI